MPDTPSQPSPKPLGKVRQCFYCGADMGFIENRHYDRLDPCGAPECNRDARDAAAQERDEAHERLDRDNGWDRW